VPVTVESFGPEHLGAVRRLCERAYGGERPTSHRYYEWAFLEAPGHRAFVAMDEDRCVAMLRAFERRYLLAGEEVACLETFDWYADPDARRRAVGIAVVRAAMSTGEPAINVGGTAATHALLPRLGWRTVGSAALYVLPLTGAAGSSRRVGALGAAAPSARAALGTAARLWFSPRRRRPPAGARALPVSAPGDEVEALYDASAGYDVAPLPHVARLRWLASGFPGTGQLISLYFTLHDRLRGWAMARVYATASGCEAAVLELYAPRPDGELVRWMLSELLARVAPYRPTRVRALATCPVLQDALRGMRFLRRDDLPIHVWAPGRELVAASPHITLNTQDAPFSPHPPPQLFPGSAGAWPGALETPLAPMGSWSHAHGGE